jgi:hypothetical protein
MRRLETHLKARRIAVAEKYATVGIIINVPAADQRLRNRSGVGGVNAHLLVTYIIPKGATSRIDKPAPACAAALGLD